MIPYDSLYIGGAWTSAESGRTFTDTNPWAQRTWAAVPDGSAVDAAAAVDAAVFGAFHHASQTGMAHVNGATVAVEPHIPFGWLKESGMGRNGGAGAIEAFTELRWISVQVEPRPVPPHFRAPSDTAGQPS